MFIHQKESALLSSSAFSFLFHFLKGERRTGRHMSYLLACNLHVLACPAGVPRSFPNNVHGIQVSRLYVWPTTGLCHGCLESILLLETLTKNISLMPSRSLLACRGCWYTIQLRPDRFTACFFLNIVLLDQCMIESTSSTRCRQCSGSLQTFLRNSCVQRMRLPQEGPMRVKTSITLHAKYKF